MKRSRRKVRVGNRRKNRIPSNVLIPPLSAMQRKLGQCAENFSTYDFECLRDSLGPLYAGVPLDDIRIQSSLLRKNSKLGPVNGTGPPKRADVKPHGLDAYYLSEHWQTFRKLVLKGWSYRCAICNNGGPLDVHHRTYERLGHERLNDCVALCRKCHTVADRRRTRESMQEQLEPMLIG